jgi:histidine kinase/DNA gyrase B/HSP90-like ATPase
VLDAPPPCPVHGDAAALERVLVNLIDNALRYAKSQVRVSAGRADDVSGLDRAKGASGPGGAGGAGGPGGAGAADGWAELAVTDDGPGIPAADLERAFGRFTRLDPARSRDSEADGGAGLGLAIVRATAQAFGGTAHLEAASPHGDPLGLRAVVRFPSADEKALRAPGDSSTANDAARQHTQRHRHVCYCDSDGAVAYKIAQRQRCHRMHSRIAATAPPRPPVFGASLRLTPGDQNLARRGCARR